MCVCGGGVEPHNLSSERDVPYAMAHPVYIGILYYRLLDNGWKISASTVPSCVNTIASGARENSPLPSGKAFTSDR